MQTYRAPIQDIRFILENFGYETIAGYDCFEDFDLETAVAVAEEAGKFCTEKLLPTNQIADQQGVQYDPETKQVQVPESFYQLYKDYYASGIGGISLPEEYGGGGAPHALAIAFSEMGTATNKSFCMCPGLAHGLVASLLEFGTEEQKNHFVPKLISGQWAGTMCLTEPQCGTDLGMMRTKAIPEGDHYRLTGTKIWITFGEHDLAENIIHLVLARLPGAPEGIKGISVFVVPKFTDDGEANGITCGGLEHKMGIHASPTCVMNMEDSIGYLVGEPHKGMRAMFVMMNFARITVGMEGVALSEISYQTALAFSKERRQGRSLNPERNEPGESADNIMVHPDVRRLLLNVKSTTEGMRALGFWVASHIDVSEHAETEAERQEADDIVALLTPVIKSYFTERGFQNVSDCVQVMGGSGYTSDWCVEQYLRDMRIGMIYEGTNHIQSLDLVGRKLPKDGGRLYKLFAKKIFRFVRDNQEVEGMNEFTKPLEKALNKLNETTMMMGMKGMQDPEWVASVSSNYLNAMSLTALGYMWARMAKASLGGESRFLRSKLKTARYFFSNILPEVDSIYSIMEAGKDNMMDFELNEF